MNFSEYYNSLTTVLSKVDVRSIENAYQVINHATDRTLYLFGNGGSAAISNHWVCDYVKGIHEDTKKKPKAVSLCSNIELITAIANDIGYEYIFSKQLEYFSPNPGDIAIAVSSSGNSPNVINGVNKAKEFSMHIISLTGFDGGVIYNISHTPIHVPANNYGLVEDIHMMILHSISQQIRKSYSNKGSELKL